MTSIRNVLTPGQVKLDLTAKTADAAVLELASTLRGHPKVKNWQAFFESLKPGTTCMTNDAGYGICIPHARTNEVTGIVMAAGRSASGIVFPTAEDPEARMHYILVIGVPVALAQEYLRMIGALARAFRSAQGEFALRSAKTPEAFIDVLDASERRVS